MTSAFSHASSGSSHSPSAPPSASAPSPAASASSATFSGEIDARRLAIAHLVGTLRQTEALAGDLLASQGALFGALIAAEKALGLSAVVSQAIVGRLGEAADQTSNVRGGLVSVHRRLEQIGKQLGIRMEDYGDAGKTPGFTEYFTSAEDTAAPLA